MQPILPRVAVVGDRGLFLDMCRECLRHQPNMTVVGPAYHSITETRLHIVSASPDVVLLAFRKANIQDSIQLAQDLKTQNQNIGIIILTRNITSAVKADWPQHSLTGWTCLETSSLPDLGTLINAIQTAQNHILRTPLTRMHPISPYGLTPRQSQILSLIAQGYSNRAIAQQLQVTEKSIENQINTIYQVLGICHSDPRFNARVRAIRNISGW